MWWVASKEFRMWRFLFLWWWLCVSPTFFLLFIFFDRSLKFLTRCIIIYVRQKYFFCLLSSDLFWVSQLPWFFLGFSYFLWLDTWLYLTGRARQKRWCSFHFFFGGKSEAPIVDLKWSKSRSCYCTKDTDIQCSQPYISKVVIILSMYKTLFNVFWREKQALCNW